MRVRITIEVDTLGSVREVTTAVLLTLVHIFGVGSGSFLVYLMGEAIIQQPPLVAIDRRGE